MTRLREGVDNHHLSAISPRDASFATHKANSLKVASLYQLSGQASFAGFLGPNERIVLFDRYASRIQSCGNWLLFVETHEGKLKLVNARFCKVPTCPMCQWRVSLRWRAKFLSLLPALLEQYPKYRWLFLTLTVKNCAIADLRTTIKHMNESLNRLVKLSGFPFEGWIKTIEVTRAWDCYDRHGNYLGRHGTRWIVAWEKRNGQRLHLEATDEVHPHFHIAGMVKPSYFTHGYWSQETWTNKWQSSLRVDYTPVVNIKAVKPFKKAPLPEELKDSEADKAGMIRAICETCKYAVKEQDLVGEYCQDDGTNSDWLKAITEQLYSLRRMEYRGSLKVLQKEFDEAVKDLVGKSKEANGEDYGKEILFRYETSIKQYIRENWIEYESKGISINEISHGNS